MEQSYKEKYEQAIEKLRNFCRDYDTVSCLIDVKEELANLFPELAESEDEKVIKEIIELVMQPTWKTEEEFHRRNVLCAWLKNIPVIIDHEKREGFHLGYKAFLERQGEQKPNGGIVREDFTQGDGWYKVNLDYLSKVQVEEIEQLVEKWNPKEVSEEEKIKKAILIYLDWLDGKKDYLPKGDYTIKDMILWLERQGEHANFLSKIQVGDKVTRNEYGVLVNLSQLKRVAKPSEKQGEQEKDILEDAILDGNEDGLIAETIKYKKEKQGEKKPVIEMKTAAESLGVDSETYNKIVDECLFGEQKLTEFERELFDMLTDISKPRTADCVKSHSEKLLSIARKMIALEQKPAWSEEDKGIIEEVVSYLINYSNIVESKEDANRIEYLIDKIQDICPHQKQEWSEEDEQHIDSLLKRLDALCRNKFERTRFAISEDREWLKSLRPQNTYNPYKAVVESIAEMCKHYDKASHSGLRDFYDNVKVKCKEAQEYDKMIQEFNV